MIRPKLAKANASLDRTCQLVVVVVVVVVVVLILTHRRNTVQSVVAGQAPITLEWKNTSVKTQTSE